MDNRPSGLLRRQVGASAYALAAVATAATALLAAWQPGAGSMIAAGLAMLLASISLWSERIRTARARLSGAARPVRTWVCLGISIGVVVAYTIVSIEIIKTIGQQVGTDVDFTVVTAALAVLVTTSLDPFTRHWRYDIGASFLRWGRNAVLLWAAQINLTVAGIASSR